MKRRYDIAHAVILVGILILSNFIHNDIAKGILLLLFAIVLIINTANRFITKDEKKDKVLYGVLLLLDCVLAAGAIYVIVVSIVSL